MFNTSRTLTAKSSAIPELLGQPALIPVSLSGTEGINALFNYKLILKTPDALNHLADAAANFNLDDFIGRELTVTIELEGNGSFISGAVGGSRLGNVGAGTREISGLMTDARMLRQEGRHVFYEVTLRPWLHLATLTTDCKIFQDMTVVEVLDSLLADYAFPVEKCLYDAHLYPKRDYQTQYNETDYAFFCRLTQEFGISFHFSHSDGAHRLVLADANGSYRKFRSSAYHVLNFYTEGMRIDEETISAFTPERKLTAGTYTTRDYDYTRPKANLTASRSDRQSTAQNNQEVYEWHVDANYAQPKAGPSQAENDPRAEGDFIARMRMEGMRSHGHRAHGSGHVRAMVPGCTFTLKRYPQDTANIEYIILSTTLTIEEVAQETQRIGSLRGQQYRVDVDFTVHPANGQEFRPDRTTRKPIVPGIATAVVVGPEDQNIWTDSLGRIKVQFPWDRIGQKNQNSSCWVRIDAPWAGNQLGGMHLPRTGQEILISYIGGDPDLPVCTGRIHNQMNLPPWSLPSQSALSGFRSRELTPTGGNGAGGRSNHLVMDDTEKKIQVQLKSDHQHSQLSLGNITRIEDNAGRKDPRGEGFELRTDGHGAVRAKDGLLITTEARANAQSHITNMGETVQRLTQARGQHETLGDLAQQHQAQDHDSDQSDVAKVIKAQNNAIKGTGGDAKVGNFTELSEPHLILASPAGIETTTPQSTHIASGEHIALTSGQHLSLSVGQRLLASVKNGIRIFTHKTGMKLIAAGGDIDLRALQNNINLLAKLNVTQTANRITITAKEEVIVNGGGSYMKWNTSGIETGTNGSWVVHSNSKNLDGPNSMHIPVLFALPFDEAFLVKDKNTGAIMAGKKYRVKRQDGSYEEGITDDTGHTHLISTFIPEIITLEMQEE
ncbi:type VI secretion system Vgr family protein [Collimonas silvisoli]|uniref:type VI secretion system Vgr family protein n=1 Tax=Collimonas silvisoli TaxID=2825884 RepID=UPI001B8D6144|nr:type VI secretion system Vgr family protein [Collimonas silvisoli]